MASATASSNRVACPAPIRSRTRNWATISRMRWCTTSSARISSGAATRNRSWKPMSLITVRPGPATAPCQAASATTGAHMTSTARAMRRCTNRRSSSAQCVRRSSRNSGPPEISEKFARSGAALDTVPTDIVAATPHRLPQSCAGATRAGIPGCDLWPAPGNRVNGPRGVAPTTERRPSGSRRGLPRGDLPTLTFPGGRGLRLPPTSPARAANRRNGHEGRGLAVRAELRRLGPVRGRGRRRAEPRCSRSPTRRSTASSSTSGGWSSRSASTRCGPLSTTSRPTR